MSVVYVKPYIQHETKKADGVSLRFVVVLYVAP